MTGEKILRFNVTRAPNALWIVQPMREAWPYAPAHKFLLLDRDAKFGSDVISSVRDMGSQPVRTAFRSPWQNDVAERWVGSRRRDLLDHVIVLHETYLKRLMAGYVRYYHEDREKPVRCCETTLLIFFGERLVLDGFHRPDPRQTVNLCRCQVRGMVERIVGTIPPASFASSE